MLPVLIAASVTFAQGATYFKPVIDPRATKLLAKAEQRLGNTQSISATCKFTSRYYGPTDKDRPTVTVQISKIRLMRPNLAKIVKTLSYRKGTESKWTRLDPWVGYFSDGKSYWQVFGNKVGEPRTISKSGAEINLKTVSPLHGFFQREQRLSVEIEFLRSRALLKEFRYLGRKVWRGVQCQTVSYRYRQIGSDIIRVAHIYVDGNSLIRQVRLDSAQERRVATWTLENVSINKSMSRESFRPDL